MCMLSAMACGLRPPLEIGEFSDQCCVRSVSQTEAIEIEFLIGRMDSIINQTKADKQTVEIQVFFELANDGDGCTFADEDRLLAGTFFDGFGCSGHVR